jgi:hypothetical protein
LLVRVIFETVPLRKRRTGREKATRKNAETSPHAIIHGDL